MAEHNVLGIQGEQLACQFLEQKGYVILERNWRHAKHELDIIAQDGKELVIVEVKTRSTAKHGEPEEAVKPGQRSRIVRAANAYVDSTKCELALRFDIISVILHPLGKPYIHHIADAFYPKLNDRSI